MQTPQVQQALKPVIRTNPLNDLLDSETERNALGLSRIGLRQPDGSVREVAVHRHYNPVTAHISEEYDKLLEAFYELGAAKKVRFGDADCILCDAVKLYEVTKQVLSHEINCLIDREEIPREWWTE